MTSKGIVNEKVAYLNGVALEAFAVAAGLVALVPHCQGKAFPVPPENHAVERAITATNLQAVAAATTDPDVWLGLALFPQPGHPLRHELVEMALKTKPQYGSIAVVLTTAMDGVDDQATAELIRQDPDNALGYYLLGTGVFKPRHEKEALEAFRKAAECRDLRVYGEAVSNVLFQALDALNLKGLDRLCAASWLATRWQNFEIINLQSQRDVLQRLAKDTDLQTRKEVSDLMLTLAGHLIGSDLFMGRVFGERDLLPHFT